ncbi:MAG: PA2169 family four-helix-bundle protein [Myxococcaceae bacterium]|nr:PA2169 family four-helix-bundle protein [Myxococcaceae bacterium]MCI0670503.1 PA2169 family four-helix-bundle protein [Myxococcaceae bacterium]
MAQNDPAVETLNTFLRTEANAVETYRRALNAVRNDLARRTLEDCQHDHEARMEALRQRIAKLGGEPANGGAEPWGPLAHAASADELTAIAALEQGEDRELHDYERDVASIHGEARRFVRMELLPRQKRTHERVSRLKRTLH